ncbi:DUF2087 domain-containing protein [Fictibacillus halophilus]|uniref:DUF2087 domain-containing protein n=1 Tax=Fictibacillus halophilus TaxID=1610490 RepID=UPI003630E592
MTTELENYQSGVLNAFLNKEGKLKNIPSQKKKKLVILEYLVRKLEGETYSELQINQFIKQYHEDFCTIRREFIVNGYMDRDAGFYKKREESLWVKWQELK